MVIQCPGGVYVVQARVRTLFPQARTPRPGSPSPSLSLSSWSYVARLLIAPPHPTPHPLVLICMDLHKTKTWLCLPRLPWLKLLRTGSTRPRHTQAPSELGWQAVRAQHHYSAATWQGELRFTRPTKIDTLMVFHFHSFNIRSLGIVYILHPLAVSRGHLIHSDDVGGESEHLKHFI